jgi:hypothetical protein
MSAAIAYMARSRTARIKSDSLDGLLAVEDQAKQSAQQTLDVRRGRAIDYTELNILRADVWGTPREGIVEA